MSIFKRRGSPYWQYDFTINKNRHRGSCNTEDFDDAKKYEKELKKKLLDAVTDILVKEIIRKQEDRRAAKAAWHEGYKQKPRQSNGFQKLRYQALKKAKGRCEACGATAQDQKLHVDHIKPVSKYPNLELDANNLQILCAKCNIGKHAWDETRWSEIL
jgi:5-methylcytosine-specific restriction endonuclease McrA